MAQLKPDPVVRLLTSFYYWGGHSKDIERLYTLTDLPVELFADSGAFSAYTLRGGGNTVKREDYAAWLKEWRSKFRVMANLDVIGDHKASMKNLLWFEGRGLDVLPVYHFQTPLKELEALCRDYDYIAVGGTASLKNAAKTAVTARALMVAREHGTAVHGFGRCAPPELLALPFYSVDSSVVVQATRYGRIQVFDGRTVKSMRIHDAVKLPDLMRRHSAEPQKMCRADYALLGRKTGKERPLEEFRREKQESIRIGTVAWKRFEALLRHRHNVPPPPGHDASGPVIWFADNVFVQYHAMIQAVTWLATGERSF